MLVGQFYTNWNFDLGCRKLMLIDVPVFCLLSPPEALLISLQSPLHSIVLSVWRASVQSDFLCSSVITHNFSISTIFSQPRMSFKCVPLFRAILDFSLDAEFISSIRLCCYGQIALSLQIFYQIASGIISFKFVLICRELDHEKQVSESYLSSGCNVMKQYNFLLDVNLFVNCMGEGLDFL